MDIDVASCIQGLLFEKSTVVIPDLGTFDTQKSGAKVDAVQGILNPPSKSVTFKPELLTDDGVLCKYLSQKYKLSPVQANIEINNFVQDVKNRINKKEIVNIAAVGKIYKDLEQNWQFVPENTNFNTAAFGLPSVQSMPINRTSTNAAAVAIAAQEKEIDNIVSQTIEPEDDKNNSYLLPILMGIFLLVVLAIVWYFLMKEENVKPEIPKENTEIIANEQKDEETDDDEVFLNEEQSVEEENSEDLPEIEDTEGISRLPGQKECIVIIGVYRKKENLQQLIEKIYNAGYDVYKDNKNGLNWIGIQFSYESKEELDETYKEITESIAPKAWIYKK